MCFVRYRNIGCYKDYHLRQRPLPGKLFGKPACHVMTELEDILTNETALKTWNDNIYQLVCRCAKEAKKERFNFFGVQNCGKLLCSGIAYLFSLTRSVSHKRISVFGCSFLWTKHCILNKCLELILPKSRHAYEFCRRICLSRSR